MPPQHHKVHLIAAQSDATFGSIHAVHSVGTPETTNDVLELCTQVRNHGGLGIFDGSGVDGPGILLLFHPRVW